MCFHVTSLLPPLFPVSVSKQSPSRLEYVRLSIVTKVLHSWYSPNSYMSSYWKGKRMLPENMLFTTTSCEWRPSCSLSFRLSIDVRVKFVNDQIDQLLWFFLCKATAWVLATDCNTVSKTNYTSGTIKKTLLYSTLLYCILLHPTLLYSTLRSIYLSITSNLKCKNTQLQSFIQNLT